MANVIVGMVMSLDGFVSDRNGSVARLYADMEAMLESEELQDAIRSTGSSTTIGAGQSVPNSMRSAPTASIRKRRFRSVYVTVS